MGQGEKQENISTGEKQENTKESKNLNSTKMVFEMLKKPTCLHKTVSQHNYLFYNINPSVQTRQIATLTTRNFTKSKRGI
jgi:hypothetical protein